MKGGGARTGKRRLGTLRMMKSALNYRE